MRIKILKETPYRKGHEKEIKIGEVHEVKRICRCPMSNQRQYFFNVDGKSRMVLESDCEINPASGKE